MTFGGNVEFDDARFALLEGTGDGLRTYINDMLDKAEGVKFSVSMGKILL